MKKIIDIKEMLNLCDGDVAEEVFGSQAFVISKKASFFEAKKAVIGALHELNIYREKEESDWHHEYAVTKTDLKCYLQSDLETVLQQIQDFGSSSIDCLDKTVWFR